MSKLVSFTRERLSENAVFKDYFIAEDHVEDVLQAMRDAVQEFLQTEDGKKMITYTCGDYNWGDAMNSVSDDIWKKHGITPRYDNEPYTIIGPIVDIYVNQDEILIEDYEEEEI